ncbi:MAG TPA: serine/threonine protein kinase [Planctomycetes bacterium]|nr:serine/threonine protein kinase [Planctomycetota bacterium]
MDPADDRFLDDLFEELVAKLTDGQSVDLAQRLVGREHLEEAARNLVELAGGTVVARAAPKRLLAGYEVLRELGHGASGTVYLARQERLGGRPVALKILARSAWLSRSARERFLAEARTLARLKHPNIVTVHDVVDESGFSAYAMEWVEGPSLAQWIADSDGREGEPPTSLERDDATRVRTLCRIGVQIGQALACVHEAGLLHRDVKPSNILLREDGTPVLSDFGLARDVEVSMHTRTGAFLGTAAYASPEQLRGEELDARADVYSLGATLYHGLTGRLPVDASSPQVLSRRIERGAVRPLRALDSSLPRDLEIVLGTAMESDRERRYPSALAFAADLERVLALRPIHARPPSRSRRVLQWARRNRRLFKGGIAGAVGAIVVSLGAAAWWEHRRELPLRARELVHRAHLDLLGRRAAGQAWMTANAGGGRVRIASDPLDVSAALALYREALLLDPRVEDARAESAILRVVSKPGGDLPPDLAREIPATAEALRALPDRPSAPASWSDIQPADLRSFGFLAALEGDLGLAVEAWRELERSGEPDPFVEGLMGLLLLYDGEPVLALPRLLRAATAFPEAGPLMLAASDAAIRCGDEVLGERLLGRAQEADQPPGSVELARVRADLSWARGNDRDIWLLYGPLQSDFTAHLRRGQLAEAEGRLPIAVRNYVQLVYTYPRNVSYRRELLRGAQAYWSSLAERERQELLRSACRGELQRYGSLLGLACLVDASRALLSRIEVRRSPRVPFQVGALARAEEERWMREGASGVGESFAAVAARCASLDLSHLRLDRLTPDLQDRIGRVMFDPEGGGEGASLAEQLRALPIGEPDEANEEHVDATELARYESTKDPSFGEVIVVGGDFDGDGIADLLVTDRDLAEEGADAGAVSVYSGFDASLLVRVRGDEAFDDFGASLSALGGDVDGDGVDDWIVGAPRTGRGNPGTLQLRSGRTGARIRTIVGSQDGDMFGFACAGLAAAPELGGVLFAVGAPGHDREQVQDGGIVKLFNAGGDVIWERTGHQFDYLGESLAALGDLDGDGVEDLAIGTFQDSQTARYVLIVSGRTGETLHRIGDEIERISFPVLGRTGDVDGDGTPDFAVGVAHDYHLPRPGTVHVFSGKTGELLWSLTGTYPYEHHCMYVNGIGDLDGDGREELAVTAWNPRTLVGPSVHIYSGTRRLGTLSGLHRLLPLSTFPGSDPPARWIGGEIGQFSEYVDPLSAPAGAIRLLELRLRGKDAIHRGNGAR